MEKDVEILDQDIVQEEPVIEEPQVEKPKFVPAPEGSLYATVDANHKLIVINQVDAFEQGLPPIEFETAWDGGLYEKGYAPEKPIDEMKKEVRIVRDGYINDIEWRVSRYRDQAEIGVATTDSNATYIKILQYMQYLREYPESGDVWFEQNPLTFEEWTNA